jgi:hypothetical protein
MCFEIVLTSLKPSELKFKEATLFPITDVQCEMKEHLDYVMLLAYMDFQSR